MSQSEGVRDWRFYGTVVAGKGRRGLERVAKAFAAAGLSPRAADRGTRIHHDQDDLELDAQEFSTKDSPGQWVLSAAAEMEEAAVRRFIGRVSEALASADLVHSIELYEAEGNDIRMFVHHNRPRNPGNDAPPGTS